MHKVLVIDFGSQYCKLIARRVREFNVPSYIISSHSPDIVNEAKKYDAIIMSGGPNSVYDKNSMTIDKEIFNLNIPILATCYGMQITHHLLGGKIEKLIQGEFGKTELELIGENPFTKDIDKKSIVWMSHYDSIVKLAPGFKLAAKTALCNAITVNSSLRIYTTQFHPEVLNTIFGKQMIKNFLFEICNLKPEWKITNIAANKIKHAKDIIGDSKIILGLSGGVDSSVVAALLQKAVGSQLIPVFIDNGLLRKNECETTKNIFENEFNMNLIVVDAKDNFYNALKGVIDPEAKRKIIGRVFVEEFTKIQEKYSDAKFLAQGTIYPDIIESSGINGTANVIKSHHNVGGMPKNHNFKIYEPIKDLFKDEVRILGLELGLSSEIINKHPFPGPGLGIRIIGEVTEERVKILQDCDDIFIKNLIESGLYLKVSQAATILTNIKTVGVQGDRRTYENMVALRAVDTSDFMTASFSKLKYDFLERVSSEIINRVTNVNRVVYDITSKPPGTIEWE